ncbi:cache domain-containing protein [Rhodopseudomonas parapalustris]
MTESKHAIRLTIGLRFSLILAVSVILAVVSTTISNLILSKRMAEQAAARELDGLQDSLTQQMASDARRAATLAAALASNVTVQELFANRDREGLTHMLEPSFRQLKAEHGVVQMQFHVAPAVSFLRLHKVGKFGDDLSTIRKTVVFANESGKPATGLEYGVEGLGIRGVTPVKKDGKQVGSFEIGMNLGDRFFQTFKQSTGADVALFLRAPQGFKRFASTFAADPSFDAEQMTSAMRQRSADLLINVAGIEEAIVLAPVKDYAGDAIGFTALGVNRDVYVHALSDARQWSLGIGLAVLVLTMGAATLLSRSISHPLRALTLGMKRLAEGDFSVVPPGLGRSDEIGEVAAAVEDFKQKAIDKAKSEAEAKARQDQSLAEERKREMQKLADHFEGAVGEIINTVSSASTELEASATTLTATATRAQEITTTVAAASEQASANVQSVASATEQLASSVSEIGRQVHESAKIAAEAVAQATETNERVGNLSSAASRIGDVVELINTIAGQTNLLALNATIEAARAGDAGRGFAVVASEVKALAEQTAKATGEISQQISGIQAATDQSVEDIRAIGGTIARISEIASTIASAVEEQGAATQEISRNVQQAAQGTGQVSSNVVDVQRGASETGSASAQVLSAAQSLSQDSNRLKAEVGRFLSTVRAS